MDLDDAKPLPAFGFLTVVEDAMHGFFGGYLVLSELGRPLEFHCSTPVQPNIAQKILYGATLRSYVSGELIGQTLLAKSQLPVQAILTDWQEVLSLATLCDEPVACLELVGDSSSLAKYRAERDAPELVIAPYRLFGTSTCDWNPDVMDRILAPLAESIDLAEPFERIGEAIREAQRVSTDQADDDYESPSAA